MALWNSSAVIGSSVFWLTSFLNLFLMISSIFPIARFVVLDFNSRPLPFVITFLLGSSPSPYSYLFFVTCTLCSVTS